MATDARANNLGVVHIRHCHRRPRCRTGLVTRIAGTGRVDMAGALARRRYAIVTTGTGTNNLVMVNGSGRHRCPGCRSGLMTGITRVSTVNVVRRFTRGRRPVMTAGAGTDDLRMIHIRRCHRRPGCGSRLVARITGIAGIYMIGGFTTGNDAVVATGTSPNNLRVIYIRHCHRRPGCRSWLVTGITGISGTNVGRRFATCDGAVMTTGAGTNDLTVIDRTGRHRCPGGRKLLVTKLASVRGIDMGRALTAGGNPVVTADAIGGNR